MNNRLILSKFLVDLNTCIAVKFLITATGKPLKNYHKHLGKALRNGKLEFIAIYE